MLAEVHASSTEDPWARLDLYQSIASDNSGEVYIIGYRERTDHRLNLRIDLKRGDSLP